MSKAITGATGAAITVLSMSLVEGAESDVILIRVPCLAGQHLAADGNASAQVFARLTGSGGPFLDISAAPIDLTPYAGLTVEFDLKMTAGAVSGIKRVAIPVRVTYNP